MRQYGHLDAEGLLKVLIGEVFPGRIAVTTSFGTEAAVLLGLDGHRVFDVIGNRRVIFRFFFGQRLDDRCDPAVVFAIGKKKVAGSAHEGPMRLKGLTTADIGRFYMGFERL